MRFLDIILKKKAGESLSDEELKFFITEYCEGRIPDYQVSALLMAICFRGLDERETATLTHEMAKSGDQIDLSSIPGIKVDKHSTGGVGDKTTLIIGPAAAALGIPVAKMSGRGLGFTGGTIDKLESIPGLSTSMSEEAFMNQVREIGIAVAGQTANLAPADKKLYALRDVTGTVQQMSLIAGSIMSKKLAAGADKIVLDVKCGSGAFMKTPAEAKELAETMVKIAKAAGRDAHALITNMDQPLGNYVGNLLEVWEALEVMRGNGPDDLVELCVKLVAEMMILAGKAKRHEAEEMARRVICDGEALARFKLMVERQGGDWSYLENKDNLVKAPVMVDYTAEKSGIIRHMNCEDVGLAAGILGAGRERLEDRIDPHAGIVFHAKVGDAVEVGAPICTLYTSRPETVEEAKAKLAEAIKISQTVPFTLPIILDEVHAE